jgi:predicted metal-binding membrane protein
MMAMMVPATLPLILLYRTIARSRLSPVQAQLGMTILFSEHRLNWDGKVERARQYFAVPFEAPE